MKLYIPKEEDYFKSYSKELEEYIEKLEHENERIYTKLDDNDKKIERLNSIINEIYMFLSQYTITHTWQKIVIEDTIRYIDELKGSNKE